jgi:hypothetical protein
MALIDKTTIVFQATGRKKQVLISWLMSQSAQWAYDANPFIIQDVNLPKKVEGETFNSTPAKDHLIARYNYLKTLFNATDIFEHLDSKTEDEPEASGVDNSGQVGLHEHKQEAIEVVTETIKSIEAAIDAPTIPELSEEDKLRNILDSHGKKHGTVKKIEKLRSMVNEIENGK